ncbi:class I SAM-dependent methyltransferase [Atopobium fossor]|uniref:class I SAM-dependent methyltransferase n=1 Tax=Atopobium fossor TaxID=39487 RepID=UPI00041045C7|nr:class I SAM-dependent methyltransferase [Atopobium fossor]
MNSSYNTSCSVQTARQLSCITSEFYRQQAQSFSATRQAPWQGWQRCLDAMPLFSAADNPSILDVGCGNLRFARFLIQQAKVAPTAYFAVDNSELLVQSGTTNIQAIFSKVDIVDNLLDGTLASHLNMPSCDLVVSFGFMHHVPGAQNRIQLLKTLLHKVKSGGYLCVSFWQFMHSPKLAAKALQTTAIALTQLQLDAHALEENDYLIGWQNQTNSWRYCHHFTQNELENLLVHMRPQARVCAQFNADGKEDNLNHYVVLQRL